MNKIIFTALLGLTLSGCDVPDLAKLTEKQAPIITLGMGAEVQIDDAKTAKVYGSDACHSELESGPLNHCTRLAGDAVQVTLVSDSGQWSEVWDINQANDKMTLTRPNGYSVRLVSSN